jgi:hypothetical protein
MKSIKLFSFVLFVMFAFGACNNQEATQQQTQQGTQQAAAQTEQGAEEVKTFKAKFVEYSFGDAEHIDFENEAGEVLSFGRCEAENVQFSVELPEAEINDTNQGIGANKALLGKTFELKYAAKQEPLYPDGPEGEVLVILEAKQLD